MLAEDLRGDCLRKSLILKGNMKGFEYSSFYGE